MNITKGNTISFLLLLMFLHGCAFSQETSDTVFVTKSGTKYHRNTCRYVSAGARQLTLQDAYKLGYTACSFCKPETNGNERTPEGIDNILSAPSEGAPKQRTIKDGRCTAITKAGTRCKRAASPGRSKCWQHQ